MAWIAPAIMAGGSVIGGMLSNQGGGGQQVDTSPWGPTIPYLADYMNRLQQFGNQAPAYTDPSQMVAGQNATQTQGANTMMNLTGGAANLVTAGQNSMMPILSGDMMNVNNNPYLQAAIAAAQRPVTQNYQESVMPGIRSAYQVGTEGYDQSKEGIASGIASRGYLDTIGDIGTNMANRGYETGLNARMMALGQIPGMTTAAIAPGQAQWGIGSLLQGQTQNQLNAPGAFEQYNLNRILGPLSAYTSIAGGGRQVNTSGVQGNPLLGAVGGGILGWQAGNRWFPQQPQPTSGGSDGGSVWDNMPTGGSTPGFDY